MPRPMPMPMPMPGGMFGFIPEGGGRDGPGPWDGPGPPEGLLGPGIPPPRFIAPCPSLNLFAFRKSGGCRFGN
eukprot:CAMPEP_0180200348 /NCGR_PEP_ID=MMETSP0987-20121128/6186_1 /TAXON_ID=697907 /ORGANISM="non described non described, Strain CCMP2293" /LENGTH=72 /DNA_ID=CAMNT_0022155477 /DNA_START=95 /DNA_END=313 /DNA_ORIENTATION=-